jgi:hypothetical protein
MPLREIEAGCGLHLAREDTDRNLRRPLLLVTTEGERPPHLHQGVRADGADE